MLDPVIHKMITFVQNLEEKDLKDKVPLNNPHPRLKKRCSPHVVTSLLPPSVTLISASGQHSRPAVGHQAAVHEVPEGTGDRGGRPAAGHVAAHAQDASLLHQDELPQRGLASTPARLFSLKLKSCKGLVHLFCFFPLKSHLTSFSVSGDKVDRGEHCVQDGEKCH